jgi:ParB-like chromosome segregation protein Spo0J
METLDPTQKVDPSVANNGMLGAAAAQAHPKSDYIQHPLSAAFPEMTGVDYQALLDSINNIGVQNPITVSDGMVIDGWHRHRAATELGMACPVVDLDPEIDPRDFVLAQNKARRHISSAQLAIATTTVYEWRPHGDQRSALSADRAKTTVELATISGVSPRTIEQAKTVQTKAMPEVAEAVKRGEIGLKKASAIAKLPVDQQVAALNQAMPNAPKAAQPLHESDAPSDDGPSPEELAADLAAEHADRLAFQKLLDADDKLATANLEITRLNRVNAGLQERLNGLMNEKNEAVKQCKVLRRQLDFARKGVPCTP